MGKGQTSLEMIAIVIVILLFFISAYVSIIKRGEDLTAFKRNNDLQEAIDRTAAYMSVAQSTNGLRINTTLPSRAEDCVPAYTAYDTLLVAICGDNSYAA